jgi:hypothetical protein
VQRFTQLYTTLHNHTHFYKQQQLYATSTNKHIHNFTQFYNNYVTFFYKSSTQLHNTLHNFLTYKKRLSYTTSTKPNKYRKLVHNYIKQQQNQKADKPTEDEIKKAQDVLQRANATHEFLTGGSSDAKITGQNNKGQNNNKSAASNGKRKWEPMVQF